MQSPAGYVGSKFKVEHDLSLLIPEVWSRLSVEERSIKFLLENKMMEKVKDFKWKGRTVKASRLGYRINANFVRANLGRVFVRPLAVFPEDMLKPELQSKADFADGVLNITEAQTRIAENIIADGSIDLACPPLKALVTIMVHGKYNNMTLESPRFRKMFTLKNMLASGWYKNRLIKYKNIRIQKLEKQKAYLKTYINKKGDVGKLKLRKKLNYTDQQLKKSKQSSYLESLSGTIGMDQLEASKAPNT